MVPARQWNSSKKRCRLLTRRKPGLRTTDEFHLRPILPIASGVEKSLRRAGCDPQRRAHGPGGVNPSSTNHVSSVAALTINGDDPCGTSFSQASSA